MMGLRCTYCESLIPWPVSPHEIGVPDGEEPRPGGTYPYSGCPCGYGKFVLYEKDAVFIDPEPVDSTIAAKLAEALYDQLPIDAVRPNPGQPRRFFDSRALTGLAESIRTVGLLEDILVRPVDDGYEIVLGERRWRAARLAGLATIPAKIVELDDDEARHIAITENIHREDLTPVEEAFSFKAYVDSGDGVAEVGRRFGGMQDRVAERLRLLNSHAYIAYQQERIDELLETVRRLRESRDGGPRRYDAAIVTAEELVEKLADGYQVAAELDGNRYAVRRPAYPARPR